jgi:hypothetical protein
MATNTLGYYDPLFYAQEGLIILEKALGRSARVHRGYDRDTKEKGSATAISRPSTFVAQDAPSTDQNLDTGTVQIQLNYWKEVKFSLTDKEFSLSRANVIADHVAPAIYAISDDVDMNLALLANDIPWYYDLAATTDYKDLTRAKKVLRDNKVPFNDGKLVYCCGSDLEAGFLELFANANFAGQSSQSAQLSGSMGVRSGVELFANNNVNTHTKGTCSVTSLAVNGAFAKGVTVINLDAAAVTGTLVPGDTFVITGHTQRYSVTGTFTAAANAYTAVTFTPPLAVAAADNAVVTVRLDTHLQNMIYHKNAFALAMAPLSEAGNDLGAKIATVVDAKSGLVLRSRIFYTGETSKISVAFDVLYGIKTLDPNLACICAG